MKKTKTPIISISLIVVSLLAMIYVIISAKALPLLFLALVVNIGAVCFIVLSRGVAKAGDKNEQWMKENRPNVTWSFTFQSAISSVTGRLPINGSVFLDGESFELYDMLRGQGQTVPWEQIEKVEARELKNAYTGIDADRRKLYAGTIFFKDGQTLEISSYNPKVAVYLNEDLHRYQTNSRK